MLACYDVLNLIDIIKLHTFVLRYSVTIELMDVNKYIIELLFTEDIVVLPAFGAFKTSYKPAELNSDESGADTIMPPIKKVLFSADTKKGSGLLPAYIAKSESIEIDKAKLIVEEYIENLNKKLDSGEIVKFELLGTLYYTKEKQIEFVADSGSNFNTESLGMGSFQVEKVSSEPKMQTVSTETPKKARSYKKAILWLSAAAVIIAFVVVGYATKLHIKANAFVTELIESRSDHAIVYDTIQTFDTTTIHTIIYEEETDTIKANGNNSGTGVVINNNDTNKLNNNVPNTVVTQTNRYHIIAGSFSDMKNATILLNELTGKGYTEASVLDKTNSLYRVSYNSFVAVEDAIIEMDKIKQGENNHGVWLLDSEI